MSLSETLATVQSEQATEAPVVETATPSTEPGLIGMPEDAPQPQGWKFADGITPDTVVGTDLDGKPVKAGDVQGSYFRTRDYTQKTQEVAAILKQFPQAAQWFGENQAYIETVNPLIAALQSGDNGQIEQAVQGLMQQRGLQAPNRGPDGRFQKAEQPAEELYDLSQLEEGTIAYEMAQRHNALAEQIKTSNAKLDKFLGSIEQQQQQMQVDAQMGEIASEWEKKGFKANLQDAHSLIGKQIGPQEAMLLAHFEPLMRHNLGIGGMKPSITPTPSAMGSQPGISPAGKSLSQFTEEMYARR